MAFSDYASTTSVRPDKPLVVKCNFDQRMKRITFASSQNCSYDLLHAKVEQCFALSATPFTIRYKDDDGEVTDVASDGDLTEAIHYFSAGDDAPTSSGSSVVSGRNSSGRRITLRLTVAVDYELSLSDTASLASLEEYDGGINASDLTLAREPLNGYSHEQEFEDDAVTVSSRDTSSITRGVPLRMQSHSQLRLRPLSPVFSDDSLPDSSHDLTSTAANENVSGSLARRGKAKLSEEQVLVSAHETRQRTIVGGADEEPPGPPDKSVGVFDRLKRLEDAELGDSYESQEAKRLSQTDRGVQWLKDQNVRAIQSMFGALPEPSVSDDADSQILERNSPEEGLIGDLALQQDPRGKYYYAYTSSSGASQAQEEASDFLHDSMSAADSAANRGNGYHNGGTSPHGLAWLADQRHTQPSSSSLSRNPNPFSDASPAHIRERLHIHPDIPAEVLKFIPEDRLPLLPPEEITNCSSCGITLDSFRYVCMTCGELESRSRHTPPTPPGKGKGKAIATSGENNFSYPPQQSHAMSSSPCSSSWTLLSGSHFSSRHTSPHLHTTGKPTYVLAASSSQDTLVVPPSNYSPESVSCGYELCSGCIESAGVLHALETGAAPGTPNGNSPLSSPEENIRALSQLRRTAPRSKGHLRHAFREKVWGPDGWKDVEQDDISNCSICHASLALSRYKCASCAKFDLCRACYSQVHEIHPSHVFLSVPDESRCAQCDSENDNMSPSSLEMSGDSPLKHPGVKCHHCLLDIVGARFHCAICDAVDICSNCESVGLPGNLTSPDGGHDSSHIMIKIPYPLESTEVETASRHAVSLWHRRDCPEIQRPRTIRQRSSSQDSAHARTVVGPRAVDGSHSRHSSSHRDDDDHHIACRICGDSIVGTRYQCATCPSAPTSHSLCAKCEVQSYIVHDPRHIFIKIPRPLDRPIKTPYPLLPATLYAVPAGITAGRRTNLEPHSYIRSLYHRTAVCDRCVEHIQGVWFHCAYCGSDLCGDCESLGGHDDTHVFLVFKSIVNMDRLGEICNIDEPSRSPPIIPHPVYLSS